MRYKHFEPPANDEAAEGPTKVDLLTQIEADHYAAGQREDGDEQKVLDDRHRVVEAARTDAAARKAYAEHVAESQAEPTGDAENAES